MRSKMNCCASGKNCGNKSARRSNDATGDVWRLTGDWHRMFTPFVASRRVQLEAANGAPGTAPAVQVHSIRSGCRFLKPHESNRVALLAFETDDVIFPINLPSTRKCSGLDPGLERRSQ